jgi:hypothetical protein
MIFQSGLIVIDDMPRWKMRMIFWNYEKYNLHCEKIWPEMPLRDDKIRLKGALSKRWEFKRSFEKRNDKA